MLLLTASKCNMQMASGNIAKLKSYTLWSRMVAANAFTGALNSLRCKHMQINTTDGIPTVPIPACMSATEEPAGTHLESASKAAVIAPAFA